MAATLKQRYIAALLGLGAVYAPKQGGRFVKLTRDKGGFYFIGESGSLRIGASATNSSPASDKFKASLIALYADAVAMQARERANRKAGIVEIEL